MQKIKTLAIGGTFPAHHDNRTDLRNYVSGQYTGEGLVQAIPEILQVANVTIEQLSNVSSTLINSTHWLALKENIERSLNVEDYEGIVIIHGTNTLEETAYFLHLTVNTTKPIVLTGAQKSFSGLSSNVHLYLLNTVWVASADISCGKGGLVVLNDQISCARDVSKTNTYRLETFQSGELGYLGFIDPDYTVQFYRAPIRNYTSMSEFLHLKSILYRVLTSFTPTWCNWHNN